MAGTSTTMKSRRATYDDYTKGFYVEDRVEALKRQCNFNNRYADVLNKSQDAALEYKQRKIREETQLSRWKHYMGKSTYVDHLRDYVAHRRVLDHVAKSRESFSDTNPLGRYGPAASKFELEPKIDKELKELRRSAKRRREAARLLKGRKRLDVFDRTLKTPELFQRARRRPHSLPDAGRKSPLSRHQTPKLILPPIKVRLTHSRESKSGRAKATPGVETRKQDNISSPVSKTISFPSVFVTHLPSQE